MPIKDWSEDRRPREKLLQRGPQSLADAELLAIFLRTGVRGFTAVDLAEKLIDDYGSVSALLNADMAGFTRGHGLGVAKYVQLQAVIELASRHFNDRLKRGDVLSDTKSVKQYVSTRIKNSSKELFHVLFLDSQNRLICSETLFFGTLDEASVYPREVLKRVLELDSCAVILAHNHPSGHVEPSAADLSVTEQVRKALQLIDVRLLDHMIVGDGEVLSFAERGLI